MLGLTASGSWWSVNAELWLQQAAAGEPLWTVVWHHPAQASISLDAALTVVIWAYAVSRAGGRRAALLFLLATALLSLGGAFCLHQLWRLRWRS